VADANLAANPTITLFDNARCSARPRRAAAPGARRSPCLADGGHNIRRGRPTSPAHRHQQHDTLTLDATAPAVAITSAGGLTNQPSKIIAGTVSDPSFRANRRSPCSTIGSKNRHDHGNGGAWSTSITLSAMAGTHYRAGDRPAANTGPATPTR